MKFDEKTHKVKVDTLTKSEAAAFITFLETETLRHEDAAADAAREMKKFDPPISLFWESAVTRHLDDVTETLQLIDNVKERFGL